MHMTPRHMVLVVLIVLVTATLFLSRLSKQERERMYNPVGVPTMLPPFADMHFVLASLDCSRLGIPATERCPEAGYSFIYPKTFYLLLPTGLSAQHTLPAAVSVFVGFIISMFAFLRSLTWKQCCYVSILLCAPPTTLALERCNVDLVVVSLLAVAILCLEARHWSVLALSAITVAALIKVYPVAALTSAVGRVRRSHILAAAFACILGLGLQVGHLQFINRNVPQTFWYSWGYPVVFMRLRPPLQSRGLEWLLPVGIEHALQIAAPALCLLLAIRIIRRGCGPLLGMSNSLGMVAGSSVYCFCWTLGSNYEYRYLVLLLTIPFLFNSAAAPLRIFAVVALSAIAPMFWLSLASGHLVTTLAQYALGLAVFCSLLTILLVYVFQTVQQFEISMLKTVMGRYKTDIP